MKARKLDDVKFTITQEHDPKLAVDVVWKEGQLFISLKNLLITDGEIWYEISVLELERIKVISEEPLKLEFGLPSLKVTLTGKSAEKLRALRHLLLPHIRTAETQAEGEGARLKSFVKFWVMDIRDTDVLVNLLSMDEDAVQDLMDRALDGGYIKEDKLTPKGLSLFSENERALLEKMEVICD